LGREPEDWASEAHLSRAEQDGLPYLFKLRTTRRACPRACPGVRRLLARAMAEGGWVAAGQGFAGKAAVLGFQTGRGATYGNPRMRLAGWSRGRRVVLLRRRLARELAAHEGDDGQLRLAFLDVLPQGERQIYEVAVLVTSLDAEILTLAQLYRDRADCENAFDELKNHWGWGGFTTQDLRHAQVGLPPDSCLSPSRLMAGMVALIDNWWSLFVRLADPDHHREVITSRPLLLHAVARQSRHAGQTRLKGQLDARQGRGRGPGAAADRQLLHRPQANCGAVERPRALVPDPVAGAHQVPQRPRPQATGRPAARLELIAEVEHPPSRRPPTRPTAGFRITTS
jgi:hypothetical protein